MTKAKTSSSHGIQSQPGDARLAYMIRGRVLVRLSFFSNELSRTAEQLSFVDQADSHDEILDEAVLEKAGSLRLDHASSVLGLTVSDLQKSLESLQSAQAHVAGVFKGQLRDDTEETLARAVQGAQARLRQFREIADSYELPKRPHEIRRNALSYLIAQSSALAAFFQQFVERFDEPVSADLLEELKKAGAELCQFTQQLEKLRERCSQKMSQNLIQCLEQFDALQERIRDVELQAGRRSGSWFPDYAGR
jgi:hypothetical protein